MRAAVETLDADQEVLALGAQRLVARSPGKVSDFSDGPIGKLFGEVTCAA